MPLSSGYSMAFGAFSCTRNFQNLCTISEQSQHS